MKYKKNVVRVTVGVSFLTININISTNTDGITKMSSSQKVKIQAGLVYDWRKNFTAQHPVRVVAGKEKDRGDARERDPQEIGVADTVRSGQTQ